MYTHFLPARMSFRMYSVYAQYPLILSERAPLSKTIVAGRSLPVIQARHIP